MASSPASYKPHLHSENSWLPSSESANPKPQNNVDLSWLPNYNDTYESNYSNLQHPQTDSDDSWLPNHNDTKYDNSNQDSDDSWLPSIPIVKNNNQNHDSRLSNSKNNNSTPVLTSNNSNRSKKPEISPDLSWLPSTSIANNENKTKETNGNNHHKKSSNQQTQNTTILNKKPESFTSHGHISSSVSECSVETDSLGGVSTLLRRWKDAEVNKNPNRKSKPSSCTNNNNDNHTTYESLVDSKYCKFDPSVPVSSRGTNDLKAVGVGDNKPFSSVIGKPRLIRGRQAFLDFLNMVEQDKRRELDSLTQRKTVSKFPNRGRIKAMLRVRLIRIGIENPKQTKSNKSSVSKTMKSLWDKFSTGVKQDSTTPRKVTNNGEVMKKSNTSPEYSVDRRPVKEATTTTPATTTTNNQELISTTASHQSSVIDEKTLVDCIPIQSNMGLENCHQWINEFSQTQSDWDEDEEEDYYNYNCDYNWINDIARPRSDWEYMREKRYQEMLHLNSYNQDIQQLLQSKSVSGFLSSDQKNIIDQLMVSRAQGVPITESRKEDVFIDETACSSTPTQSPAQEQRSWNHHDHEHDHHQSNDIYDNNQMASSSQSPSVWPNVYLQNNNTNPQSSFINHPSIEMEVIYDLRGYVQQIHQEVIELKKLVTSCVNMQVNNQHQSTQNNRSEQVNPTRNCCVCYATQADSFMYRCGHMCTCYDCGLELQCSSGKCPICEGLILDVVRVHVHGD